MTISVSSPSKGNKTEAPFARKIASARNAAGYSFEQLAVTCGLTIPEIIALETGTDSDPLRARRVATALQLPVASLM